MRSADLVCRWERGAFVVEEFVLRRRVRTAPLVVLILDAFSTPRAIASLPPLFPAYTPHSVRREATRLLRLGFLVPAAARRRAVAELWNDSFAAACFAFSTRNVPFLTEPRATEAYLRRRLADARQPPLFKDYPRAPRLALPRPGGGPLAPILAARRTHRKFSRRAVAAEDLGHVLSGTFGRTGWIDGGILGRLLARTSPSAGARHPIECYVLVWNVRGVAPGAYHYSVRRDALERLRRGDPRRDAVAFAAGQKWIAGAAFLCVLTAVVARTFWKYPSSDAFRLFLLDAGHLAQTFLLLAAERGLGGFVTAALAEDVIERRLGLDGAAEPPLYLCGAGRELARV